MTNCSNGPSLWKPTKASQLFTQRNIEAAGDREEAGGSGEGGEGKHGGKREKQIVEVEQ